MCLLYIIYAILSMENCLMHVVVITFVHTNSWNRIPCLCNMLGETKSDSGSENVSEALWCRHRALRGEVSFDMWLWNVPFSRSFGSCRLLGGCSMDQACFGTFCRLESGEVGIQVIALGSLQVVFAVRWRDLACLGRNNF